MLPYTAPLRGDKSRSGPTLFLVLLALIVVGIAAVLLLRANNNQGSSSPGGHAVTEGAPGTPK